jgi:hypothetical protein
MGGSRRRIEILRRLGGEDNQENERSGLEPNQEKIMEETCEGKPKRFEVGEGGTRSLSLRRSIEGRC